MRFILASSSKQRQDILKMIGLKYEVLTSDVDEDSDKLEPGEYVKELSYNKAMSVAKKVTDKAVIVAMDTIVYGNGKKYEKPKTKEEALLNLKELSGTKHSAYTGVTIIDLYHSKAVNYADKVDIYFKDISQQEMDWYVNNEPKMFKCCGYAPLGKASAFIQKVDGDYNVLLGISPCSIFTKLKELGCNINDFEFESECEK